MIAIDNYFKENFDFLFGDPMEFDVNDILDLINRYLGLALIIAVVFIIIVFLIIYKLMHYNVTSNKSEYRMRNVERLQIKTQAQENIEDKQVNEVKKVEKTTCKFCGGDITDSTAFCPLCGTRT